MSRKYIQNSGCEASELDDEWIILNTENFTVTKINQVGGLCWSILSEAQTVESIVESVERHFHGSGLVQKEEIEDFIMQLENCGVIRNVP
ncbi:PqqD family protein [Bacillus haimaensis]|uniref:PqqD family protein n=1 Tax=Bacillus haimaensis TaxID=3160967 RepID=UPI003AA9101A